MTPYEYSRLPIPPDANGFVEVGMTAWLNEQGAAGWELVCIQEFADAAHPVATFKRVKVIPYWGGGSLGVTKWIPEGADLERSTNAPIHHLEPDAPLSAR